MSFHNGFIVQELDAPIGWVENFVYKGLEAYQREPLLGKHDQTANSLNERVGWKPLPNGMWECKYFITDYSLLSEYLQECEKRNIKVRLLFAESNDYSAEQCVPPSKGMTPIGFEYSQLPVDNQIVIDLDTYPPFEKYIVTLNQYGLFNTHDEALAFKKEYDDLLSKQLVGDGEMEDAFVFKVYEVDPDIALK